MFSARTSTVLALITAGNMLLWFLFQGYILLSRELVHESDAFFASFVVPQLLMMIANSSLMHVLVPFFSGEDGASSSEDVHALSVVMLGVFVPLSALLGITAAWWVPMLVSGFSDEAKQLTVLLTRIQIGGMTFTAWAAILVAACHGKRQFARAELAPCVATLCAFLLLLPVLPAYGIVGAAWLMAGRSMFTLVFLLPNFGLPQRIRLLGIHTVWRQVKPLLLSSSYYKSDQMFDRFLSSLGHAGDLSTLYFAQQIHLAGNSVLGKALCAPIVPALASLAKKDDWDAFTRIYRKGLIRIVLISFGCLLAMSVLSRPLILLVTMAHPTDVATLDRSYHLLILLGGMLTGGLAGLVTAESFFAMGDTRTPALVFVFAFTVGLPLKTFGFFYSNIEGLAIATTLFSCISPVILFFILEVRLKKKRCGRGEHFRMAVPDESV